MKALLLGSRRDHHVLGNAEAWLELCRECTVSMHIGGLYKLARRRRGAPEGRHEAEDEKIVGELPVPLQGIPTTEGRETSHSCSLVS